MTTHYAKAGTALASINQPLCGQELMDKDTLSGDFKTVNCRWCIDAMTPHERQWHQRLITDDLIGNAGAIR